MGSHFITQEDDDGANYRKGRSRPIGSEAVRKPILLTSIGIDDNGDVAYLGEIGAERWFEFNELPFSKGDSSWSETTKVCWNRLAVKTERSGINDLRGTKKRAKAGEYCAFLTLSKWPYSTGLAFHVPFKRPKKSDKDVLQQKLPSVFKDEVSYIRAVESLMFDFSETDTALTASISLPPESLLTTRQNSANKDAQLIYGVCVNPKNIFDILESSEECNTLMQQTEDNRLSFTYDGSPSNIHSAVRRNAREILQLSIRQAMGGLLTNHHIFKKKVQNAVDSIYRDHINRLNKQAMAGNAEFLGGTWFPLDANDQAYIAPKGLYSFCDSVELHFMNAKTPNEVTQVGEDLVVLAMLEDAVVLRIFDHKQQMVVDQTIKKNSDSSFAHRHFLDNVVPLFKFTLLDDDQRTSVWDSIALVLADITS
jgi:hypothetical protein